jgi:hypothetical protein
VKDRAWLCSWGLVCEGRAGGERGVGLKEREERGTLVRRGVLSCGDEGGGLLGEASRPVTSWRSGLVLVPWECRVGEGGGRRGEAPRSTVVRAGPVRPGIGDVAVWWRVWGGGEGGGVGQDWQADGGRVCGRTHA